MLKLELAVCMAHRLMPVTGKATENSNGYSNITLNGTIRQIIANPPVVGTVFVEMVSGTATAVYENGEVRISSAGGVIKNVALYEGEYTADNQPAYQPKSYGAELAECRRYYRPSVTYNMVCHYAGYLTGVHFEVPMRIVPTMTITSTHTGTWFEVGGTTTANGSIAGISSVANSNFTVGNWYRVGIELNADL